MRPDYERRMIDLLHDAARDQYADWRCEAETVSLAYATWRTAGPDGRADAHTGYCAALEQEELAARVYAEIVGSLDAAIAERQERTSVTTAPRA